MSQFEHPVQAFQQGYLECAGCNELLSLDMFPAMLFCSCTSCGTSNFVPKYIDGFWVFAPLATGGMGSVYRAYNENYGDMVFAIKMLPPENMDDPVLKKNFREEIITLRRLGEHPALVRAVASGADEIGEPYLAMDLIEGESMMKRLDRLGPIPQQELLMIALRVLSALGHIYRQGYLYRDCKPENIIISIENRAYICDYGICMTIEEAQQDQGDVLQGSPFYLPPERIIGEGEGLCSEIYSLGLVMYHGITGKVFYSADDVEELIQLHLEPPEHLIDDKMKGLDPDLAEVIKIMIRRNPEDRYQSFMEVERDLFRIYCKGLAEVAS